MKSRDGARTDRIPDSLLSPLSEFVAAHLGLHYPQERWQDLERGFRAAVPKLGLGDPKTTAHLLVTSPVSQKHIEILATFLTVGETYFFRETEALTVFSQQILPALIAERRGHSQKLRFWSAGCCTGEEPYTLAMLVCRALPDIANWDITILGTDINLLFLQKAAAGIYSEWSFRRTPPLIREHYFRKLDDGRYKILPRIKNMVTFASLNLAEDLFPSSRSATEAIDVIFCRNVLIYFAEMPAKRIVQNFDRALVEGGWLIVSPTEMSQSLFSEFAAVNFPGVTLYRKGTVSSLSRKDAPQIAQTDADLDNPTPDGQKMASQSIAQAEECAQQARTYANEGDLARALIWCEKAIAQNKLNPAYYYLRATILEEEGSLDSAVESLKQTLFLNNDFVLAHFALGNITRRQGKDKVARKYYLNAQQLLQHYSQEDILLESGGLTAGRLAEIIIQIEESEAGV